MPSLKRTVQSLLRHSESLARDRRWTTRRVRAVLRGLQSPCPYVFDTALFNFTIDFELVWGNANVGGAGHPAERRLDAARRQAENFKPFVAMLEGLGFPISWAIVGKLADGNAFVDPDARFAPEWYDGDWYARPTGLSGEDALAQGAPYLDLLKSCRVAHEVLSHGYAHIDYGDPAASEQIARTDMALARDLLREYGFDVEGFVYPCNHVGHADLLPKLGYRIARGADEHWRISDAPAPMTPVGFCIDPGFFSLGDVKRVVDAGIERRAFIHPWMHLVECSLRERDIENFYRPLFEYVLRRREQGRLEVLSFRHIRDRLCGARATEGGDRSSPSVSYTSSRGGLDAIL